MLTQSRGGAILDSIRRELKRIQADRVRVKLDDKFAPSVGVLVHVEHGGAYWHLLPENLLALLRGVKSATGSEAVKQAIERQGATVWHGPAPEGSRDSALS